MTHSSPWAQESSSSSSSSSSCCSSCSTRTPPQALLPLCHNHLHATSYAYATSWLIIIAPNGPNSKSIFLGRFLQTWGPSGCPVCVTSAILVLVVAFIHTWVLARPPARLEPLTSISHVEQPYAHWLRSSPRAALWAPRRIVERRWKRSRPYWRTIGRRNPAHPSRLLTLLASSTFDRPPTREMSAWSAGNTI